MKQGFFKNTLLTFLLSLNFLNVNHGESHKNNQIQQTNHTTSKHEWRLHNPEYKN